ncbi:MAG TPA: hypothetical protein VNS34_26965 [Rhizobiaceae bacterium]|nr:hypothetical protein [Rhizobiaceae bacterium]
MAMDRASTGAAFLLALTLAGCTTPPAEYAATLSAEDPKWRSPECERIREAALTYEDQKTKPMNMGVALLLGPYGLGIAAAGREHQEKQRKLFARDLHMRCSSLPLPKNLQIQGADAPAR